MKLIRVVCLKVKKWLDQAVHPISLKAKDPLVQDIYDQEELKQVKFHLKLLALFYAGRTLFEAYSSHTQGGFLID